MLVSSSLVTATKVSAERTLASSSTSLSSASPCSTTTPLPSSREMCSARSWLCSITLSETRGASRSSALARCRPTLPPPTITTRRATFSRWPKAAITRSASSGVVTT